MCCKREERRVASEHHVKNVWIEEKWEERFVVQVHLIISTEHVLRHCKMSCTHNKSECLESQNDLFFKDIYKWKQRWKEVYLYLPQGWGLQKLSIIPLVSCTSPWHLKLFWYEYVIHIVMMYAYIIDGHNVIILHGYLMSIIADTCVLIWLLSWIDFIVLMIMKNCERIRWSVVIPNS